MVKLAVNSLLALWLFASAFLFPQSTVTGWNVMLVAVVVAALGLFSYVAVGRPGFRFTLALVATWLFMSALVLPHESLGTVLHDTLLAVILAFVTLLPPKRWARSHHAQAHAA